MGRCSAESVQDAGFSLGKMVGSGPTAPTNRLRFLVFRFPSQITVVVSQEPVGEDDALCASVQDRRDAMSREATQEVRQCEGMESQSAPAG